jgi:hypothetical protein
MKPLPFHLKVAALGLSVLTALSSTAVLYAGSRYIPRPAASHLANADHDGGCDVNPRKTC